MWVKESRLSILIKPETIFDEAESFHRFVVSSAALLIMEISLPGVAFDRNGNGTGATTAADGAVPATPLQSHPRPPQLQTGLRARLVQRRHGNDGGCPALHTARLFIK